MIIYGIDKPNYKITENDIEVFIPLKYKEFKLFGKKITFYSGLWWLKLGKVYKRFLRAKQKYYDRVEKIDGKFYKTVTFYWVIGGITSYSQKDGYITTYGKEKLFKAIIPKGSKYYYEEIPEYLKNKKYKVNYPLCSNKIKIIGEEIVTYLGNVDKKYSYVYLER